MFRILSRRTSACSLEKLVEAQPVPNKIAFSKQFYFARCHVLGRKLLLEARTPRGNGGGPALEKSPFSHPAQRLLLKSRVWAVEGIKTQLPQVKLWSSVGRHKGRQQRVFSPR